MSYGFDQTDPRPPREFLLLIIAMRIHCLHESLFRSFFFPSTFHEDLFVRSENYYVMQLGIQQIKKSMRDMKDVRNNHEPFFLPKTKKQTKHNLRTKEKCKIFEYWTQNFMFLGFSRVFPVFFFVSFYHLLQLSRYVNLPVDFDSPSRSSSVFFSFLTENKKKNTTRHFSSGWMSKVSTTFASAPPGDMKNASSSASEEKENFFQSFTFLFVLYSRSFR